LELGAWSLELGCSKRTAGAWSLELGCSKLISEALDISLSVGGYTAGAAD
jgi:hypothetical protein